MLSFFENRVETYPDAIPATPPNRLWPFLWAGTAGMRGFIASLVLLTATVGAFEAFLFGALGEMVDRLMKTTPATLWQAQGSSLLWLGALLLASPLVVMLQTLVKHQALAGNFPMRLRWNFHRLMLGQSLSFYQDEFAGRVAAKVMQTALAVRDSVLTMADVLVFVTIYFIGMVSVVAHFDRWLLWPFLAWMVLYGAALMYFVPRLEDVSEEQADGRSTMTGRVTDAYANISTVKLFSHGRRESHYVKTAMQEFMGAVHGQMRLITGIEIVNQTLNVLLILAIACIGLWRWSNGVAEIGGLAAAIAMALRLNGLSHWIMWEVAGLFENLGTVIDGMNTLSRPTAVLDAPNAQALQVTQGEICFDRVSFAYQQTQGLGHPVIDNLQLTIRPGEKIGLVGRSGAGKSTLVNLLLRFYDINAGQIRIDGTDIATVTQESLRAKIGMVTQDTSLLHRSVRENVVYGRPDASDEEVLRAITRAHADAFLDQLTDLDGRQGLDAHVGERGVKLSGGQRQRIAIARVMLKDAPILLLDEATSALDSEVEAAIQESLYQLMEGKTVIAIAHRLSTIAAMDRLIVIDQGKVVETGTHQSLLTNNGLYARLWAHQSGGFLGTDDREAVLSPA